MRKINLRNKLGLSRRVRDKDKRGDKSEENLVEDSMASSDLPNCADSISWRNHYEIEPMDFPRQRERAFTADTWWIVDLSLRPKLIDGATPLVERCMQTYGWQEDLARRVLHGYHQFWQLKIQHEDWQDTIITPSLEIDRMWQQHILDVVGYVNDSMLFCNHILLRQPKKDTSEENVDLDRLNAVLNEKRERTKSALEKFASKYSFQIDEFVWFEIVHCRRPSLFKWKPSPEYEKPLMAASHIQQKMLDVFEKVFDESATLFSCRVPSSGSASPGQARDTTKLSESNPVREGMVIGLDQDLTFTDVDDGHAPPLASIPKHTKSLFDSPSVVSAITQRSHSLNSGVVTSKSKRMWRFFDGRSVNSRRNNSESMKDTKSVASFKSQRRTSDIPDLKSAQSLNSRRSRSVADAKSIASTRNPRSRSFFDSKSNVLTYQSQYDSHLTPQEQIQEQENDIIPPPPPAEVDATVRNRAASPSILSVRDDEGRSVHMSPTPVTPSVRHSTKRFESRTPFSQSSLVHNSSMITDASNIPKLTIRLRDEEEINYLKISYAARMGKVFAAYAARKAIPLEALRFFTPTGDVIGHRSEATPAFYGLEDQDEILVTNLLLGENGSDEDDRAVMGYRPMPTERQL